jgi:hypothetical protein
MIGLNWRLNVRKLLIVFLLLLIGCSQEEVQQNANPPSMFLKVNEDEYLMEQGVFSWSVKEGLQTKVTTVDAASPNQIAHELEPILVDKKSELKFVTEGEPIITVYLWNQEEIVEEIPIKDNHFFAPVEAGFYTYEARAEWENGDSSYTVVIEVE